MRRWRAALSTPDVVLLHAAPGSGHARVLAEVIRQAAERGERTLFLAKTTAALDCVLPGLLDNQAVLPLCFLGPEEAPPDAALAPITLAQRRQLFKDLTLQRALAARAQALAHVNQRSAEKACWDTLRNLVQRLARERERHRAWVETSTTKKAQEQAQATSELPLVNNALEELRPLAEAKQQGRWWTAAWWRATWRGHVVEKMAELASRRQALENVAQQQESNEQECPCELDRLASAWQEQVELLADPAHRPNAQTEAALAAAAASWEASKGRACEDHEFACRWADYLTEAGDNLGTPPSRLGQSACRHHDGPPS